MTSSRQRVRVLVTARDVGAAHQAIAFMADCRVRRRRLTFSVLAQMPALSVFVAAGVRARPIPQRGGRTVVSSIFDTFRPHFVLAGLSGFGRGVDETVLAEATRRGTRTGAIQDYWGYLGQAPPENRPGTFFVLDETAARLTLEAVGPGATTVVTGSPKHDRYRALVPTWRRQAREVPRTSTARVMFFMQPEAVPGIEENLMGFLKAASRLRTSVDLSVRLHPADRAGTVVRRCLKKTGVSAEVVEPGPGLEAQLIASDIVATCFSTVGLDHSFLQRMSPRPLGALLYLRLGVRLRRFMKETIGVDRVPGAEVGLGVSRDRSAGLTSWMEDALREPSLRENYWEAAHRELAAPGGASARIARYLEREVVTS